MTEEDSKDRPEASPYADIKNPFVVGEEGAQAEFMLDSPEEMPHLSLGAKVLIEDTRLEDGEEKKVWIPSQVHELRIVSPFQPERENKLYLGDDVEDPNEVFGGGTFGPQDHQPMLISLSLDQEMRVDGEDGENHSYEYSAVQRPPSIQSKMVFPELLRENTDEEPSLEDILQIKEDGVPLGAVGFGNKPLEQDGQFLKYKWDVENLDIKHTFIVGESGSGKTVLLKRIALHLRDQNDSPVLMTDVQGDFVQLLLDDIADVPEAPSWQQEIDRLDKEEALDALEPFKLVIPVPKGGLDKRTKIFKKLAKKKGAQVQEIGLRLRDLDRPSEMSYLFTTTSDYAGPLIDDAVAQMEGSDNWSINVDNLESFLRNRIDMAESGDADSISVNGTNYPVSSLRATKRGAVSDLKEYFDHHGPSQDWSNNPLDALQYEGTTIFYLDHLPPKERVMYEMQLIQWLEDRRSDDWNPFVFIDEAHQIIPSDTPFPGAKDTFERLKLTFKRMAREGRKYNISFILSTQNPNDIDSIVNEQCHTRIVMKSSPKNARAAQLNQDELKNIVSNFGKGQMFLKSPFNDTSEWLRIHSYLPNLPHEDMDTFSSKAEEEYKQYK